MAQLAIQTTVFAGEGKGGFRMIETPVAVQAGGSDEFIFDGFFQVPCWSGGADGGVTFPAFHRFMESLQRKPRIAMIKPGGRLKGIEPMTFLAIP
jgi:hypothetical protein